MLEDGAGWRGGLHAGLDTRSGASRVSCAVLAPGFVLLRLQLAAGAARLACRLSRRLGLDATVLLLLAACMVARL